METSVESDGIPQERAGRKKAWPEARGLVPEPGPKRTLAAATFINMIGNGLFMAGAALFFTRSVGIPVAQVGLGLGIAALVGLLAGIPVGHLADRRGPRQVYQVALTVQGAGMAALVLAHSLLWFVVCMCLVELANSAGTAARGPLTRAVGAPNPTRYRSYLRALNNIAAGFGALAAGVVVQLDTRPAYLALILGNAVSFLVCAAVASRIPSLPPIGAPAAAGRWIALKDTPYMVLTALDGIMSIQNQVLIFVLPLWIVGHTQAPRWFVGASMAVNTVLVVCLQVRASRGIDGNAGAGRVVRRAGVAFLVGMALMASAGGTPRWLAMVAVAIGVVVYTFGELWHTAASFELSFGLAPAHAQGQYSGLYGIGQGLSNAVGPPLLAMVCIGWGAVGWLGMGGIFVVVGLLMPHVVSWSDRTRKGAVS